jgi:hypothetical protein
MSTDPVNWPWVFPMPIRKLPKVSKVALAESGPESNRTKISTKDEGNLKSENYPPKILAVF